MTLKETLSYHRRMVSDMPFLPSPCCPSPEKSECHSPSTVLAQAVLVPSECVSPPSNQDPPLSRTPDTGQGQGQTSQPILFPKSHASPEEQRLHFLDIRHALAFYLQRTKSIRKSPRLFITIADRSPSQAIFSQRISLWVSGCIIKCYRLAHILPPGGIMAHSTRAHATVVASCRRSTSEATPGVIPKILNKI